jgi:rubrerythrin
MAFTKLEDIIKFAVKREEIAYRLYTDAAAKSTTIPARKMFEEMAAEELGHQKVFSKVELASLHQDAANKVPDMHLSEYMTDIPIRPDMTYDEILRYAIKTEESAWRLYTAAADMADDPQLKKTLLAFADVEKGHKKRLEDIYDERVLTEM